MKADWDLVKRLMGKARKEYDKRAKTVCWACSVSRCGAMFDNTCSCCRVHR